jgi:hypothetical protein
LQPSAFTLPTMHLKTCAQFAENELMGMITSALDSGARYAREFAEVNSITESSLKTWLYSRGLSWKELKVSHGPPAQGGIKGRSPCRRRSRGFERSELPKNLGLLRSEAMRLRY